MEKVKVIIPIYKVDLPYIEEVSLKNNLKILSNFTIVFVCPNSLNADKIEELAASNIFEVERFDDDFFKGIEGYNRLMMSDVFYKRFLNVEYILICQTDAFVFRNELTYWCDQGYDYIGGPWIGTQLNKPRRILENILCSLKVKKRKDRSHLFKVGNGGFSLRKTTAFYRVASENKTLIQSYTSQNYFFTEDLFWSFKAVVLYPDFKIPDYTEALHFAIDRRPQKAMKLLNGKLPFACHGLNKKEIKSYWISIIQSVVKS